MKYQIFHEIDQNPETNNHLREIIESIEKRGWVGDPLIACGDQLLNGCHRATACDILGIEPEVHQVQISCTWGDGYDDLLNDFADASDSESLLRIMEEMYAEGLIDEYSVEIIRREVEKEGSVE